MSVVSTAALAERMATSATRSMAAARRYPSSPPGGRAALRAPVAEDLRVVLTVLRIAASLERVGDYAKNMAKRTTVLAQMTPINGAASSLRRMAKEVERMLRDNYVTALLRFGEGVEAELKVWLVKK